MGDRRVTKDEPFIFEGPYQGWPVRAIPNEYWREFLEEHTDVIPKDLPGWKWANWCRRPLGRFVAYAIKVLREEEAPKKKARKGCIYTKDGKNYEYFFKDQEIPPGYMTPLVWWHKHATPEQKAASIEKRRKRTAATVKAYYNDPEEYERLKKLRAEEHKARLKKRRENK